MTQSPSIIASSIVGNPLWAMGWREWVSLPLLDIPRIKAKIDTGARTSALHAFYIDAFTAKHVTKVRFGIHPLQRNVTKTVECEAVVVDYRWVSDSGGHREKRYVVNTLIELGSHTWPIEITLTNRDSMRFRMLLGRTALNKPWVVYPSQSYLWGKRRGSTCENT